MPLFVDEVVIYDRQLQIFFQNQNNSFQKNTPLSRLFSP